MRGLILFQSVLACGGEASRKERGKLVGGTLGSCGLKRVLGGEIGVTHGRNWKERTSQVSFHGNQKKVRQKENSYLRILIETILSTHSEKNIPHYWAGGLAKCSLARWKRGTTYQERGHGGGEK